MFLPVKSYFVKCLNHVEVKHTQGCACFAKTASELRKIVVQHPQNLEFEYAIAMLKCENIRRTNSTNYETQNINILVKLR